MPIAEQNQLYERSQDLRGGTDTGRSPAVIEPDRVESAVNVQFRGTELQQRPAFRKIGLTFESDVSSEWFRTQIFQGAGVYSTPTKTVLLASVGGHIYEFSLRDNKPLGGVRRITPAGGRNNRTKPLAWFQQAGAKWMVIQDDDSRPILYDGVTARRADPGEVPIGNVMAYGQGRLFVVRGNLVFPGDLVGVDTDSEIKYTEINFLNEGQPFGIRSASGIIRCLAFLDQQDTTTGQGDLVIGGDRGISTAQVSASRDTWKNIAFERDALIDIGITGHNAFALVNGDLWFRSSDGWRSYRQARAEVNGWARIPMSQEMSRWFDSEDEQLLLYSSAIFFDKRLLVTAVPQQFNGRVRFAGLASLDFDILSTMSGAATYSGSFTKNPQPGWDGCWTGIQPTRLLKAIIKGHTRAFAFCWNPVDGNCLYEIMREQETDLALMPRSRVKYREFDFKKPDDLKGLHSYDVWLGSVSSNWTMSLNYIKDRSQRLYCWGNQAGPMNMCLNAAGPSMTSQQLGGFPRISFTEPPDDADESGKLSRQFFVVQPILDFKGGLTILKTRIRAQQLEEDPDGAFNDAPPPLSAANCPFPGESLATVSGCATTICTDVPYDERITDSAASVVPYVAPGGETIVPFIPPPS